MLSVGCIRCWFIHAIVNMCTSRIDQINNKKKSVKALNSVKLSCKLTAMKIEKPNQKKGTN